MLPSVTHLLALNTSTWPIQSAFCFILLHVNSQGSVHGSRRKALYEYIQLVFLYGEYPTCKVAVGTISATALLSTVENLAKVSQRFN